MIGPIIDQRYCAKLKDFIQKSRIKAEILGEMEDEKLARFYQQADLFAMTSQPYYHSVEGFGLSYLEASANGIPILAHKIGGVQDAVKHGVNGLLVDPNNLTGLVTALKQLLNEPNLRTSLGNTGRGWVEQFSWKKNAEVTFKGVIE